MYTGVGDINKLGLVDKWNGNRYGYIQTLYCACGYTVYSIAVSRMSGREYSFLFMLKKLIKWPKGIMKQWSGIACYLLPLSDIYRTYCIMCPFWRIAQTCYECTGCEFPPKEPPRIKPRLARQLCEEPTFHTSETRADLDWTGLTWPLFGSTWPLFGSTWPLFSLTWPLFGLTWPLFGSNLVHHRLMPWAFW